MDSHFLQLLIQQFKQTTWLEWLAFSFALLQVVLAWRNHILNFYAGILSVSLYIFLFYQAGLFAESALNIYYLFISVWGIVLWQSNQKENAVSYCKQRDWIIATFIVVTAFLISYVILRKYTSSNVPFYDALASALAWAGSWLLIKRKIENWIILNISNAIAIPLFMFKGLALTALLTVILFVIAIRAYFAWKKFFISN